MLPYVSDFLRLEEQHIGLHATCTGLAPADLHACVAEGHHAVHSVPLSFYQAIAPATMHERARRSTQVLALAMHAAAPAAPATPRGDPAAALAAWLAGSAACGAARAACLRACRSAHADAAALGAGSGAGAWLRATAEAAALAISRAVVGAAAGGGHASQGHIAVLQQLAGGAGACRGALQGDAHGQQRGPVLLVGLL